MRNRRGIDGAARLIAHGAEPMIGNVAPQTERSPFLILRQGYSDVLITDGPGPFVETFSTTSKARSQPALRGRSAAA